MPGLLQVHGCIKTVKYNLTVLSTYTRTSSTPHYYKLTEYVRVMCNLRVTIPRYDIRVVIENTYTRVTGGVTCLWGCTPFQQCAYMVGSTITTIIAQIYKSINACLHRCSTYVILG